MARLHNRDGSLTFLADDGSGATQTVPAGTPEAVWVPQYNAFIANHQAPFVSPPPSPIVILPTSDPGVPGAAFVANNTLMISQGGATPIQIGATGPIGLTGAQIG